MDFKYVKMYSVLSRQNVQQCIQMQMHVDVCIQNSFETKTSCESEVGTVIRTEFLILAQKLNIDGSLAVS